ncbi:MAG: ribosome rescue GTPase HflX, partial [Gammaproteobacteria bacterium]
MSERHEGGERAVLVHVDFMGHREAGIREDLEEFRLLVKSAGAEEKHLVRGRRSAPDSRLYVGEGKAEEIKAAVDEADADVVIFNHALSPAQERNLERVIQRRVLDRTGLILDIFAQRARSHEGKLQVELAQLRHLASRLVRGWTHLERQKGGIGLRGPGESQLEMDRRLIGDRISHIEKRLEKVRATRELGRRARKRSEIPTVSLVGYTNAGKSTLFNALTGGEVYADDRLFATLDPTLRRIRLPNTGNVIVADTVGFVRHLPHELVAAFRSTLEETEQASLLVHVIDVSSDERAEQVAQVQEVLSEIDAEQIPQLEVYNKIDRIEGVTPKIDRGLEGRPVRVWISAQQGIGLDLLRQALDELLAEDVVTGQL